MAVPAFLAFALTFGAWAGDTAPKPAPQTEAQRPPRVAFDSFANVNYGRARSLPGWLTTRAAVEATLRAWFGEVAVGQDVVDGTPADLEAFLRALPGPETCDVSVVYLGSIQNSAGSWEFVGGERRRWADLLAAAPPPPHPCRIVVLDACHAAVVRGIPAWAQRLGTVTLLAAAESEKTFEFSPAALAPVDVRRRCPRAWGWAEAHLPRTWREHISFLGLIWLDTVAETTTPPTTAGEWRRFFEKCARNAAGFRAQISRRWASTVQAYPPLSPSTVPKAEPPPAGN